MRSLPTTFMQKKRHNIWILLMSLALFLLAAVLSLLLGSAAFSPAELWTAAGGADAAVLRIFLHVRLPRTLACILAGSALAVWSLTSDTMVDRGNLSSMLMLVGGLIAIVGFIKAGVTFSSAAPVYKPTGERIRRYEIYYQAADKPALCAAVSSGDMERLVNIPRNDKSSSLLLTLYATESGSFSMGQVSQYVPHAFEPVTDVVRFSAEQGKLAVGLV